MPPGLCTGGVVAEWECRRCHCTLEHLKYAKIDQDLDGQEEDGVGLVACRGANPLS